MSAIQTMREVESAPVRQWVRRFRAIALLTGAGLAAGAPMTAGAAGEGSTDAGAAPTNGLEEIVVTATRREESISRVPISVTAFSQDMIDQRGVKDFTDIVRFTPGVSIDTSGTNAISIRGISSSGGAGTTGIYIDDTPIQMRALGFNPDDTLPKTFDLDHVEVLRGPQGTLFGSGSEGGTVRYIMTQPSVTKESTYMRSEVSYTAHGDPSYETGIAHGGPLVDGVLGYRASFWYRYDGGWINRVDPTTDAIVDKNANHANTVAARVALLYTPVDGVAITPSLMYQNARKHDQSTYWAPYSNVSEGQFNNGSPERNPVPDEYYLPALKIEIDLGSTKLISNSSYYHRKELTAYEGSVYDLSYYQIQGWNIGTCGSASTTAAAPCSWYPLIDGNGIHLPAGFSNYSTPNTITNKQESYTQEFRWQSNDPASRWNWTVGTFWSLSTETSVEELKDTQIIPFWTALFGSDPRSYSLFQDGNGNGNWYYCNGVGTPGLTVPNCDIYYNGNVVHDRQLAGFGDLNFAVTDQLKLDIGGRYAKTSFSLQHHGDGLENAGPVYTSATQSENAFTPKAGLTFQYDPNNLYYATYAKGFRPGGGNAPLPSFCDGDNGLNQAGYPGGAPLTYTSDTTQSYEIGSKNSFNEVFRVAASVYYIKWNKIQQNVYVAYNCGLQFTDNLGTAVAKGFDLQTDLALGNGFSLDGAVGYTSARFTANSPHAGLASAGDAISGEAAINYSPGTNPPWNLAFGPQYKFKLAGREAFVRLDWEYTSRNPWLAPVQDPTTSQYDQFSYTLPATSFVSMRSGISFGDWQVAAFVDNLFDSHTTLNYALGQSDYLNPAGPPTPQQNAYTFRPRTVGITATFRR
jgi:outer membrane receptor protein involved in Fe transport